MKKINDLIGCSLELDILGVSDDSRKIKEGYLFVATKGFYVDHLDYVENAIDNGAVAVVSERDIKLSVPVIVVEDVNHSYIDICKRFYNVKPEDFFLIGITGTDGKTTSTTIIRQILQHFEETAVIGTNGAVFNDKNIPTNNTTPCVNELYEIFSNIKNDGCSSISMEVSSEALLHNRLEGFKFDIIGYTNITEDHLNVHKSIDNYIDCKLSLLNLVHDDTIVVFNGDDKNCRKINSKNMYSYGVNTSNDFVISDVKEMSNYVEFSINNNDKLYKIVSPLLGIYNVYNVTLAFVICLMKGLNPEQVIQCIKELKTVSGRGEVLDFGQDYKIILDYAHTYNGIKNILESVKNYKNIITVTGAAGGREKEKREKIGSLVLKKSDVVIFTMDDPRYEDVDDIIDQMVGDSKEDYIRITDRKEAIKKALSIATPDSVVLILGKGRDNYMAIEDRKDPYCDYDVIKSFFD